MNYPLLVQELSKPEYAGLTDAQAAAALNAKMVAVRRPVPTWEVKKAAIEGGYYPAIVIASQNAEIPVQVRGLAISVLAWIDDVSGKTETIDMDLASAQTMLAGLVASTLITQQQADAINAMANQSVNWALHTLGDEVGAGHVKSAREMI